MQVRYFEGAPSAPQRSPQQLARADLRKFAVAAAQSPGAALEPLEEVERARQAYDAGTHEMCQGRNGDGSTVLYLIPRKKRERREPYFTERAFA